MQHLTVICTVYHHTPFLIMLKDWFLRIPEKCVHHFTCSLLLRYKFLSARGHWLFPLHTLVFALQLIMVYPHFDTSDNAMQKGIIIVQKGSYRCSSSYTYAVLYVALEPSLHRLHGSEVCHE